MMRFYSLREMEANAHMNLWLEGVINWKVMVKYL